MKIHLVLLACVVVATSSACSFHPARRGPVAGIDVATVEISPLTIAQVATYQDRGGLCIEGYVDSLKGKQSYRRGTVKVLVYGKDGTLLETTCGSFSSEEHRDGGPVRREHSLSNGRFDVKLISTLSSVGRITLEPSTTYPCADDEDGTQVIDAHRSGS